MLTARRQLGCHHVLITLNHRTRLARMARRPLLGMGVAAALQERVKASVGVAGLEVVASVAVEVEAVATAALPLALRRSSGR